MNPMESDEMDDLSAGSDEEYIPDTTGESSDSENISDLSQQNKSCTNPSSSQKSQSRIRKTKPDT